MRLYLKNENRFIADFCDSRKSVGQLQKKPKSSRKFSYKTVKNLKIPTTQGDTMRTDILRFSLRCSSFVVFVAYLSLFLGCGDSRQTETNETADKGAISLNVVWPESNTVNLKSSGGRTKALTGNPCVDFNIKTIVATVYTISDTEDTKSPSWDCGERNGTIDKVSPGQMYVVIEAYVGNVDNSPELRGQSDPIQVVAGEENTDLLTNPIKMFPTSDILIWDVGNWDEKNWN